MPFYDFRCTHCDTVIEVKAGIGEKERGLAVACPQCESMDMEQVYKSMSFLSSGSQKNSAPVPSGRPSGPCGSACGCFH